MLPVELLEFSARPEGEQVMLEWTTATELNNAGFHVERSSDGVQYDAILEVEGMGTTVMVTHYEAVDPGPLPGLSYYRLRQTDFNGTNSYSDVVAVERAQGALSAYPNPTEGLLHISGLENGAQVEVLDALGRMIHSERCNTEQLTLDAAGWTPGCYTARVTSIKGPRTVRVVRR
jgi:hypothetical protein